MNNLIFNHKSFWSQKYFIINVFLGFAFLFFSLFVNYWANVYTVYTASNSVSDLILDHVPTLNVNFIFIEGAILFWVFVSLILIYDPKKISFVLKSIALFVLIRSLFIILTHTAIPPDHAIIQNTLLFSDLTLGNDLFFSSHTGLPFLMALIFWQNKRLRLFFMIASVFFGVSVLLGHLHYSIDVFAAFFITYSIFQIARKFFAKDYHLFLGTMIKN